MYSTFTLLEECLAQIGQPAGEQSESENSHFRQIFASKDVHLLAVFILVYVGVEDTIGGMSVITTSLYRVPDSRRCSGWIVTYMIDVRGGGPSSGYISSGFFGGMSHLEWAQLYSTYTSMNRFDDGSRCLVVAQPKGMSSVAVTLSSYPNPVRLENGGFCSFTLFLPLD